MFDIIGKVWLKKEIKKTQYYWGPISDIAGKPIALLERNKTGDCLCVTEKGLVDVRPEDIERYVIMKHDIFGKITEFVTG